MTDTEEPTSPSEPKTGLQPESYRLVFEDPVRSEVQVLPIQRYVLNQPGYMGQPLQDIPGKGFSTGDFQLTPIGYGKTPHLACLDLVKRLRALANSIETALGERSG